jgi:hypothetical protein
MLQGLVGLSLAAMSSLAIGQLDGGDRAVAADAVTADAAKPAPLLLRLKIATIGAARAKQVADLYVRWLDYKIRESGKLSPAMAASWGAPQSAGHPFFLLSSDGYPDVFVRIVGIDPVPGYKPSTTAGWNAFLFMVGDIQAEDKALRASPFKVLKSPYNPMASFPRIFSMDVEGPAGETLFMEYEQDGKGAFLPLPRGKVGRPHLAWVSGPDILKVRDWYADNFGMVKTPVNAVPVPDTTSGATMPNTLLMMKERANFIELEGHPAQMAARPQGVGQLPPGNAMASFSVVSLDAIKLPFVTPPQVMYGTARAATVLDPNGNRVELIEEAAKP